MLLLNLKFAKVMLIWCYSIFLAIGFVGWIATAVFLVRKFSEEGSGFNVFFTSPAITRTSR
jgi:hypothetical protein